MARPFGRHFARAFLLVSTMTVKNPKKADSTHLTPIFKKDG